jgi:hypothetical protein
MNLIPESIIKEAIEKGGWNANLAKSLPLVSREGRHIVFHEFETLHYNDTKFLYLDEEILLDPIFWQALGKARGWRRTEPDEPGFGEITYTDWLCRWHDFIDVLSASPTQEQVELFWTNLP